MITQLYHGPFEKCSIKPGVVDLIIADPPYDILKGIEWDKFENYMDVAKEWLSICCKILRPGGALLLYGSPCREHIARMTIFLIDHLDMNLVQDIPWVYTQGGDSRLHGMKTYAVRHERLVWFEKKNTNSSQALIRTFNPAEAAEHYSEEDRAVALSKGKGRVTNESLNNGRPPRSFIDIPRENSRSVERKYGHHPSMKPLKLCERLIKVHSNPKDLVVIPFAGSGSELLSVAKLGRKSIGYELEPSYVELIKKRFEGHDTELIIYNT